MKTSLVIDETHPDLVKSYRLKKDIISNNEIICRAGSVFTQTGNSPNGVTYGCSDHKYRGYSPAHMLNEEWFEPIREQESPVYPEVKITDNRTVSIKYLREGGEKHMVLPLSWMIEILDKELTRVQEETPVDFIKLRQSSLIESGNKESGLNPKLPLSTNQ